MKKRIMSPAQIFAVIVADLPDHEAREQAHIDIMAHHLSSMPGSDLRVYIDRDMGGWVMELPDV